MTCIRIQYFLKFYQYLLMKYLMYKTMKLVR